MAASYHLLVPCPNGRINNTTIRLTVYVVPRLQTSGPLTDWNTDWRNWPRVLDGSIGGAGNPLRFTVFVDGGAPAANQNLGPSSWTSPIPDPAVWDAVFGTNTVNSIDVRRFSPVIRSDMELFGMYDAASLSQSMEDLHAELATSPTPPTTAELAAMPAFDDAAASPQVDNYISHIEPTTDFESIDLDDAKSPVEADFHESLTFLQSHPELLRHLGLAIDLEVEAPLPAAGQFRVAVSSTYNRPDGTAVPIEVMVGADGWPVDGPGTWPEIGDGSHSTSQFDLGASVFGVGAAERSIADGGGSESADIPQLGDAGLSVARAAVDLTDEVQELWEAQEEFETDIYDWFQAGASGGAISIPGLLLTVGRRYDVWDEEVGSWFSIWEREVPNGFGFPRDATLDVNPDPDEGWMTYTASTESQSEVSDPEPSRPGENQPLGLRRETTTIRLSPLLFSWKGWSLAADPPGRAFSGVAGPIDRGANLPGVDPNTGDEMGVQAVVDYEVPDGVLPRLRYTRRYKFRARTVDYAGNSRPLAESHPGGVTETELIRYGRQSALGAPVIIRRELRPVPGWGDIPTTLVITSELDSNESDAKPTSRVVFPARVGQFQCELHGFPGPDGLPTSAAVFNDLVNRTACSIDDHAEQAPVSGELVMSPPGTWSTEVDYLVEPGQTGYAFSGLPDMTGPAVVPLATTWPESTTTSLELRGGPERTLVDTGSTEATVTARLPKGVTRTAHVSATLDDALAGHWKRFAEMDPAIQAALADSIRDGQHWMFSSPTAFQIIHAVRQPLMIPTMAAPIVATRGLGTTTVDLAGTFGVDVKSTDKLVVRGSWTDPIDTDGEPDGIVDRTTSRWLFDHRLDYDETDTEAFDAQEVVIGDTKRHEVSVSIEGFSRYARYFTERAIISFDGPIASVELASEGVAARNVRVSNGTVTAQLGADYEIDGPAGTITRTRDSRIPEGVNVIVDFIRLPINRWFDEAGQAPFPVTIRNTAVPAPISLIETLPAFSRTGINEGAEGPIGVEHLGQTIRVWLARPWFTTGVGELLGVVLDERDGNETVLARDAMSPAGVDRALLLSDFPRATTTASIGGTSVAGHPVVFDPERELWFSDISISGDVGYRPFIKLALCRYQPVSVTGAHLGPIIRTEPTRLGSNRTATIELDGTDVIVSVIGEELGNEVTAFFQEADPDIADPDLRWSDVGDSQLLGGTPDDDGVRWSGRLPVPATTASLRVVIEDAEVLTSHLARGQVDVRNISYIEVLDVPPAWNGSAPTTTTTTIPGGPGAVDNVSVRGGDQRVLVEWDAAAANGNPITGYRIEQLGSTGGWIDVAAVPATRTRHVVRSLANGVEVTFRVRGESAAGDGPWSAPASATPNSQAPGRVRRVRTFSGGGVVRVTWRPAAARGAAVERYVVERREPGGAWGTPITVTATETTIAGVAAGTALGIRVRAENQVGAGAWSVPTVVTVEASGSIPAQVHGVALAGGDGTLAVTWLEPDDGGVSLVRYELQLARPPAGYGRTLEIDADQLTITLPGLVNGETYTARVRAVNLLGAGDWSTDGVGVPTS